MSHSQQVEQSASAVRRMWERHGIKQPLRFVAFCLSMLPIPVIQQAGQAIDRHLSDRDIDVKLQQLWDKVVSLNAAADTVTTVEESVLEIARTVGSNQDLQHETKALIQKLGIQQKEFKVLTEQNSFQSIINSIIVAESSVFASHSGSTNSIEGTTVHSDQTLLHATGGSKNYISDSTFRGSSTAIGMHGITTTGDVSIKDKSIGLGSGSSINFGPSPFLVEANCPICGTFLREDRRKLAKFTHVRCSGCNSVIPSVLPPENP